jgi:hypothetical protein
MAAFQTELGQDVHRKLAAQLFNFTWDLIEQDTRTEAEADAMINAAHASLFHWSLVGTALNLARGEWQLARVYALVGQAQSALWHAEKSLQLCLTYEFGDLDVGFAYEALARAYALTGDVNERDQYIQQARQWADRLPEDDRGWLVQNLESIA